ncbi:MAG: hypothetical protein AB1757_18230 [Acidobacteriota bacterium]
MTPEKKKEKLDSLAHQLFKVSKELEKLIPELALDSDQETAQSIIEDLFWAVENCTTIGLHQMDKALNDSLSSVK